MALRKQGKIDEAIAAYRKIVEIKPQDTAAMELVRLITRFPGRSEKEYTEALQIAEACVQLRPTGTRDWQVLGWACYRNGQWQKTIEAMEKAVALQNNTGDPDQWFFLAMAHWQSDEKEQARAWFDKSIFSMVRRNSKNVEALAFRNEAEELFGLSLTEQDRQKIALAYSSRKLQENPDD